MLLKIFVIIIRLSILRCNYTDYTLNPPWKIRGGFCFYLFYVLFLPSAARKERKEKPHKRGKCSKSDRGARCKIVRLGFFTTLPSYVSPLTLAKFNLEVGVFKIRSFFKRGNSNLYFLFFEFLKWVRVCRGRGRKLFPKSFALSLCYSNYTLTVQPNLSSSLPHWIPVRVS